MTVAGILIATIAAVLFTAIITAAIVPTVIIRGYVASILWGWFIVPTFDLPAISVPVAIGITYVVSIITNSKKIDIDKLQTDTDNMTDEQKKALIAKNLKVYFIQLVSPFLLLGIAWIVKGFM